MVEATAKEAQASCMSGRGVFRRYVFCFRLNEASAVGSFLLVDAKGLEPAFFGAPTHAAALLYIACCELTEYLVTLFNDLCFPRECILRVT